MDNFNVSSKKKQIKGLLIKNHKEELKTFKEIILVDDNIVLFDLLSHVVVSEISSISYQNNSNNYKWLYTCLRYMLELITKDASVNSFDSLYKVENIKKQLETKQNNIRENIPNNLKIFYIEMLDTVSPIVQILEKNTLKDKRNKNSQNWNASLYEFVNKLIFKIKNFDYLFQLVKVYPDLVNCYDSSGKPLILILIKKQINNYKNNASYHRILNLNRALNLIINANTFYIDNKQLSNILTLLKKEESTIDETLNPDLYNFIKGMSRKLKDKVKNQATPQNINELFKRYHIEPSVSDEYASVILNKVYKKPILDFTNKLVVTIDLSNKVRLFDDAISCEILPNGNYLIGVYIADVASRVHLNSELDQIAYERAETIYLMNNVIDMLPLDLAYKCSLNTNGDKQAIAYLFEFTKDIELYDFRVEKVIININDNLTFNSAQKEYHCNHISEVGKMLKAMINFNNKFDESCFYDKNYHIVKDEIRKMSDEKLYHGDNDCSHLIASLMILVNRSMAKFFNDNHYPFLYRVNNSNIDEKLVEKIKKEFGGTPLPKEIINGIDSMYSRSKYSSHNTGHNGLKIDDYCHTTNPIRSYASLLTQRIICEEFLNGGLTDEAIRYYEDNLSHIASHLNDKIYSDMSFKEEYDRIAKKNSKSLRKK